MHKTTTIRVSRDTYDTLKSIARQNNEKMQDVLEKAVKDYTKKQFFKDLNISYARLKADGPAWTEGLAEREGWDSTLQDGLEAENGDQ